MRSDLGSLAAHVDRAVERALELAPRVAARDHTVWQDDPGEVADRLGWLDAVERARSAAAELISLADGLRDEQLTDVVLVGMGGSSLYPEVLARTFGPGEGRPRLHVLDSTDPAAVLSIERRVPWGTTAVVASSKSGTTIETRAHLARLTDRLSDALGGRAGDRLLAVTDPGSELDAVATAGGFRAVVHGQPDVGGRFSALTPFGLLPAAILGIDPAAHVEAADPILSAAGDSDRDRNTGAVLGAVLAAAADHGRDKLTVLLPDEIASFGAWIEQLIAESTGKHGVGLLPVVDEPRAHLDAAGGDDRIVVALGEHDELETLARRGVPVVQLPWSGPQQLTAEVARFEVATAFCGALLGVNPFDQPDVQAAKAAAGAVLERGEDPPAVGDPSAVLEGTDVGDYIALLAFVAPGSPDADVVQAAAARLRERYPVPVTVGIGPRYLHSTGQLHKGGPGGGRFLVVVAGEDEEDVHIPGRPHTFGQLKRAQAAGDLAALYDAGRRVVRLDVETLRRL